MVIAILAASVAKLKNQQTDGQDQLHVHSPNSQECQFVEPVGL